MEATQQALIESLPTVLVLHLKRFLYDTNVGDVVKIGKQIAFGPDLDISPGTAVVVHTESVSHILHSDLISPTSSLRKHPVKYQLFGGELVCVFPGCGRLSYSACSTVPPWTVGVRRALYARCTTPQP